MKPNRRYGFLYLGSRYDFTTRLLFAVDVSGSMSSQDLARGFSVINRFFEYGVETIDVIQFDTEIHGAPLTLKRAMRDVKVIGRGGTSFAPVIAFLDEHGDYDARSSSPTARPQCLPGQKTDEPDYYGFSTAKRPMRARYEALRPFGRSAYLKEAPT